MLWGAQQWKETVMEMEKVVLKHIPYTEALFLLQQENYKILTSGLRG